MAGLSASYQVPGLRWTGVQVLIICLCLVPTGGQRGNYTDQGFPNNETTEEYIDHDRMATAVYNVPVDGEKMTTGAYNVPADSDRMTTAVYNVPVDGEKMTTAAYNVPVDSDKMTTEVYSEPVDSEKMTTAAYNVPVDSDRMTTAGYNVTICKAGHGYPDKCPQAGDPITHTKCCRYYQKPTCCEPRARKVCAIKHDGLFVVTGFDIDPDPEYNAIFCPQPDQSDLYVSCGYTGDDMTCFNRQTSLILVWVSVAIIFGLFPIAFGIFMAFSIRAERREEREMLKKGFFVSQEMQIEIEARMVKKKEERAAAAKAAEKAAEQEKEEREKKRMQMIKMNGKKNRSTENVASAQKEFSEGIEANGQKGSSEGIAKINEGKKGSEGMKGNGRKKHREGHEAKGGKKKHGEGHEKKRRNEHSEGHDAKGRKKHSEGHEANRIEKSSKDAKANGRKKSTEGIVMTKEIKKANERTEQNGRMKGTDNAGFTSTEVKIEVMNSVRL